MPFGHMALPVRQFPGSYTSRMRVVHLGSIHLEPVATTLLRLSGFQNSQTEAAAAMV